VFISVIRGNKKNPAEAGFMCLEFVVLNGWFFIVATVDSCNKVGGDD
jgi:hypothetical protein